MNDITVTISGVNASNAGTVGATLMSIGKTMTVEMEQTVRAPYETKAVTARKPRAAKVVEEVEEEATFEDSDEDTFVDDTADEVEEAEEDNSAAQVGKLMEALRTYAAKNSVEAGKKILKKYSTNKSAPHPKFVPAADYPKIYKELGVKTK